MFHESSFRGSRRTETEGDELGSQAEESGKDVQFTVEDVGGAEESEISFREGSLVEGLTIVLTGEHGRGVTEEREGGRRDLLGHSLKNVKS